jgi:hypothetical protein
MHTSLDQLTGNFVELVLGNADTIRSDTISSFGRKTTFQVKLNRSDIVLFTFFHLSCFSFLISLEEPLEVIVLELANVLVFEFLRDFD